MSKSNLSKGFCWNIEFPEICWLCPLKNIISGQVRSQPKSNLQVVTYLVILTDHVEFKMYQIP